MTDNLLWVILRVGDMPLGSRLFSGVLGISDNLLDPLNHSLRPQNATDDPVTEGYQSHDTDD